jgi:hypothetical protein
MAGTSDDSSTFRLLADEYAFFLRLTRSSKDFANKLVQRFLEEGECDRDGRVRYKIWEVEALPGGMTLTPYDGDFWRSVPRRDINCTIEPWNSSARRTEPASAKWREFDGREVADHRVFGIRLNHDIVLEFLESAGVLSKQAQSGEPLSAEEEPEETPESELPPQPATAGDQAKPPGNPPPKQPAKRITLKGSLPDAVKLWPRPRDERDYAGYLQKRVLQQWSKHSIQTALSALAASKKRKPKKG